MKVNTLIGAALIALGALLAGGCASEGHDRSSGEVLDDSAITVKVKSALLRDKDLNSFDIKVQTFNGVVQLSGFVDSRGQIDKATEVASAVNGVQKVQNDLIHKPAN